MAVKIKIECKYCEEKKRNKYRDIPLMIKYVLITKYS